MHDGMEVRQSFVKKDKEIDLEGRCFIVDFFFGRNIAKMQCKARKNGYFYIKVASRNITTEVNSATKRQ